MLLSKEVISKNTLGYGLLSRYKMSNHSIYGPSYSAGGIDANTVIMLHMDGASGSTTFTDSSLTPKTVNVFGNAKISTAQSKFSGASGLFDGTGDYIDILDSAAFDVGSANFCFDFWFMRGGVGTAQYVLGQNDSASTLTAVSYQIQFTSVNKLNAGIYTGSTSKAITSSGTYADTTNWHHVEFSRTGNTMYLFVDGTSNGTLDVTGVTVNNSSNKIAIGRSGEINNFYYNGYLEEFRFNNGVGGHTSSFTPPTAPYSV